MSVVLTALVVLASGLAPSPVPAQNGPLARDPGRRVVSTHFAHGCAAVPALSRPSAVCSDSDLTVAAARAFVNALPDGGDHGMPDAWSALRVARAEFTLAGPTAWSDSGWDEPARRYRRPAVHAVLRALELDSTFVPALVLLQDLCPYPQLWDSPARELRYLRAVPLRALPTDLDHVRFMLELEVGDVAQARLLVDSLSLMARAPEETAYFDALVTSRTGDVSAAWMKYLAAINLRAGAVTTGWPAYEAMLVADSVERAAWRDTSLVERAKWLQDFWERRDGEIAATPGTRWGVHQSRWAVALQRYRLWPSGNADAEHRSIELMVLPPTMVTDPEPTLEAGDPHLLPRGIYWREPGVPETFSSITRRVFDDRGLIYLRHGEPRQVANYWSRLLLPDKGRLASDPSGNPMRYDPVLHDSVPFFPPPVLNYTTWRYQGTGGDEVLSFGQLSTASSAMWAFDFPRGGDLAGPCHLDARFCSAIRSDAVVRLLRSDGHASLAALAKSDDDVPVVRRSAGLITEAYALAGGGVLVAYAVPVDSVSRGSGAPVSLRFAIASFRPGAGLQPRLDVTRVVRHDAGTTRDTYFAGWFELPSTPGPLDLAVSVFNGDSTLGDIRRHPGIRVPAFDGRALAVSQPILGRDDAGIQYQRHGVPIALNPTNGWRISQPATIYYELDGLIVGHEYETAYEFWRSDNNRTIADLALTSRDRATSPQTTVQRQAGLQKLKPGNYRLVVRIRDRETGQEASATGYLNVVK
jgi:hypothetical protein